jgi:CheY-like chemotaxis protein
MRTILEDDGYTVFEAADGRDALAQLVDSAQGMVVLLDLLMPAMSGFDVLHALAYDDQLATRHAFIVVTAMVTRALSQDVVRLLIQRGVPLLEKPFRIEGLLEAVGAAAHRLTPLPRIRAQDA